MNGWLEKFAYRMQCSGCISFAAGLMSVVITF